MGGRHGRLGLGQSRFRHGFRVLEAAGGMEALGFLAEVPDVGKRHCADPYQKAKYRLLAGPSSSGSPVPILKACCT